jgi:hypothetical protein
LLAGDPPINTVYKGGGTSPNLQESKLAHFHR